MKRNILRHWILIILALFGEIAQDKMLANKGRVKFQVDSHFTVKVPPPSPSHLKIQK